MNTPIHPDAYKGAPRFVILEREEYWALWRDLTEQARILNETAAIFRWGAKNERKTDWQFALKTAIKRERKARHMLERAKMFKAIYWEMRK